ncbi:Gfo/Idh/MocA family oxidoreductase [Neobacillus cucumis]|uniref:Gfo/Idh/MocA family protein n=1 Tax=Neobacillus cucumis TaxID=1740721 RepID=UPI002040BF07|nr:Gfo/Idh/MocA family oxidoreductase [Neobacillus cucumis]MCM3726818.1 Gfo/Idh/MocA family oxidoreductase [Neobacillus cucumis]
MIKFSIIGGASFRAQYYLRIAQALPDRFRVCGMVVRDEAKGQLVEQKWNVATYRNLTQLLKNEHPDFIVVSVSGSACPEYLLHLGELGIPALAETPPAPTIGGLTTLHEQLTCKGAKIQVAEQYHLHPAQQARLSIIQSGRLGNVTQATVSISHFYHGVSLMRKMLGISFEDANIRGMRFEAPIVAGPDRSGPPKEEKIIMAERDLVWLEFDHHKLGIYDFTKDQHRSWIRSNHLSIRGDRGEIFDNRMTALADYSTPVHLDLKRINKGEEENQEGYYLEGIMAGEQWVYRNPFIPARLYDDEIAIASCLKKMGEYVAGGPSFYSLPEASQDQYLGLMMEKAIRSSELVRTVRQPWAE